jgi:hypothetical protein
VTVLSGRFAGVPGMRARRTAALSALVCILPCTMPLPLSYAAKLDREQRRVARQADREADRFGASPMERLALFETLAVEATFRNPAGGDLDSVGALQERSHYGSVQRRLNVKLASRRFLSEARAMRESGQKFRNAGELAASVQRPREDLRGRYHEERGTALEVVNRYGGLRNRGGATGGLGGRAAGGGSGAVGSGAVGATTFDPGNPQATQSSLAAAPVPIASAPVAPPEFIAQPVMPAGYQQAPSAGGPAPPPEVSSPEASGLAEDFSPELAAPGDRANGRGNRANGGSAKLGGGEGLMPARQLMQDLVRSYKLPITARKEPGHATGGDHDPNTKGATAWDLGGDEATREAAFRDLTRALGVKGAKYKGKDVNVVVDGLRYQIISRDHGSGPHLHVGVRHA